MKKNLKEILDSWPKNFIQDTDLAILLGKTDDSRYSVVKRALASGVLIRLRKGLYLIASKTGVVLPDEFELALLVYGPSIVSLESALSYHNLIPEAVYTTTCVSPKRAQEFKTPIGVFSYKHVPQDGFYAGVKRVVTATSTIFVADPWRALADFVYTRRRTWKNFAELEADLRIDIDVLMSGDNELLKTLSENYPSTRVRVVLKRFLKEIIKKNKVLV